MTKTSALAPASLCGSGRTLPIAEAIFHPNTLPVDRVLLFADYRDDFERRHGRVYAGGPRQGFWIIAPADLGQTKSVLARLFRIYRVLGRERLEELRHVRPALTMACLWQIAADEAVNVVKPRRVSALERLESIWRMSTPETRARFMRRRRVRKDDR